jgi:hypothetical protein
VVFALGEELYLHSVLGAPFAESSGFSQTNSKFRQNLGPVWVAGIPKEF